MRKITKLLTLALAALMIMSVMPVSAAFTDVSVDDEALSEAVELLSTLGVAKGTTDTTFGPEACNSSADGCFRLQTHEGRQIF
jgi:Tfp pilus assembly protein FimT